MRVLLAVKIPLGVARLGPTRLDDLWPARAGAGFDAQHFLIDRGQECTTCPAGKTSTGRTPAVDNRRHAAIKVKPSTKDGRRGDRLAQCRRSRTRYPRRTLTIRPQPYDQALQVARQRQATAACQAEYARRRGYILTAVGQNGLCPSEWCLETVQVKTLLTPCAPLMAESAAA